MKPILTLSDSRLDKIRPSRAIIATNNTGKLRCFPLETLPFGWKVKKIINIAVSGKGPIEIIAIVNKKLNKVNQNG